MNDQSDDQLKLYRESIQGFITETPECIDKIIDAALEDKNFVLLKYLQQYIFDYATHVELKQKWKQIVDKHVRNIKSQNLGMSSESARMLLKAILIDASEQ